MQEIDAKKPRGRSAIEAAHGNVMSEDEARLDLMISDLYGVDRDEATEIHLNYHVDRMLGTLAKRYSDKGIRSTTVANRLRYLDISGAAYQVAKGRLSEAAAVDGLLRSLRAMDNQDTDDDRYINFYG
jgi:hypothetical protein